MNLMIVLVPVLLLSMVFTQNAVLDLNFPALDDKNMPQIDEKLQLQLIIRDNGINIADTKAGIIKHIPKLEGEYDFNALSEILQLLKSKLPNKTDITLLLSENTDYQTLVSTMDTTRSYPAVVAANLVEAELFPDISIGDAPELSP
jgi:hypothetical protein